MASKPFLVAATLAVIVNAQQPGEYTSEVHPSLSSQKCTARGCTTVKSSVVLDANYRWTHSLGGYDACFPSGPDPTLCPNVTACAANCVLEGVDYASYGIQTSGDALTLNLFTQSGNVTSLSSPRVYLLANNDTYDMFKLLNQEIAFDVDVSKVPCGINGALYLSEMSPTGSASSLNKAGAAYGTGYCDAQCPSQNFVNGVANLNGTNGACCNEMDLWEANSAATALTPHPCNITGPYTCTGTLCGAGNNRYDGVCDEDGCDFNPYRLGAHKFYGPKGSVDTTRKFTVVTQFLTNNNRATGALSQIKRLYVQDGRVIQNSYVDIKGMAPVNSISDQFCKNEKAVLGGVDAFEMQGGMKGIGGALGRGMVLVFSIWDDSGSEMLWLDSTYPTDANSTTLGAARGPCPITSGQPAELQADYPDAAVTFSNIKVGDLESTFSCW